MLVCCEGKGVMPRNLREMKGWEAKGNHIGNGHKNDPEALSAMATSTLESGCCWGGNIVFQTMHSVH